MKINIVQYKWEGSWGPFKIKVPCGECGITEGIIKDVMGKEFAGENISLVALPWLDNWFKALASGGWHAPIVLVNGKLVAQGAAIDRGVLSAAIRRELVKEYEIPSGTNVIFSKPECSFCAKAKKLLKEKKIAYEERDIIENPLYTAQLFALTKRFFPKNKPVTTPQIWLKGEYVGGFDDLERRLSLKKH